MIPRPQVEAALPAVHGGPHGEHDELHPPRIDFSTCVNAYGPAPEVLAAVRATPIDAYPDPLCLAPRRAAAAHFSVAMETVACGSGAAELIFAAAFAVLRPGDEVLVCAPAFGEYARAAALCGARVGELRGASPFAPTADEIASAITRRSPRMVFMAAPSSPAGVRYEASELRHIADTCSAHAALLVLDQSYDAFLERPLGLPLWGHPAALTVRSLTKDHALAGLRAGLAFGPSALVAALERARMPWSVSALAQAAVVAALSDAAEVHAHAAIVRLRAERVRLEAELAALGVPTVPTATHYLLAAVGHAAALTAELRAHHGIAVRDCASFGLPDYIRIAARRPYENDALIAALAHVASHHRTL